MSPRPDRPDRIEVDRLARLIKLAVLHGGRGWCSTKPASIAHYLIAHGVTLPAQEGTEHDHQA